jgi:hypothetical protein
MSRRDHWKPNGKQAEFLAIPFSVKEAFYGGGAGSGKSDVLLMYGIVHKLHENPRFKQVFMRRTYQDLKKEIVGRSREIYSRFGATFNQTDMVWTFPRPDQFGSGMRNSGAQIFLGHCEEEKNVHNYDSMEISLFSPDELTNATEYIYIYIAFQRNRAPKDADLPSITRGAGMPGGIGHTFVKKRFIDPCPLGGKIIIGKGGNKRIYIHATLEDNKDHIDPNYAQSLDGITVEAERKAKKYGDWSAYLGQVFDEFRHKHYSDEPDNACHTITPFNVPAWWPRFVVIDWGFAAMNYVGYYAVSPKKRLYVYREQAFLKTKIEDWAPIVKDYIDDENPKIIKLCKSAGQDRGQEHTIQQQVSAALGRDIELSNNSPGSRVAGKMLVHEYLRWTPKPVIPPDEMPIYSEEHAMWVMRNKGLDAYKLYLKIFDPPEEETNIPRLQIFCCEEDDHENHPDCCPLLIDAIRACNYDKPKNNKPAEDVAEFEGDDPYDDLRYACDTAERYFEEAGHEFKKVQAQAALIEQLKVNQDHTAFYRNMRTIESADKVHMVSRFHRGSRH